MRGRKEATGRPPKTAATTGARIMRLCILCIVFALAAAAHQIEAAGQDRDDAQPQETVNLAPEEATRRAEILFVRGLTQQRLRKPDRALAAFREALVLAPDEPAILSAIAQAYVDLDDATTAEYYARRAFELEPRREYGMLLVDVLTAAGRPDAADKLERDLASRFPDFDRGPETPSPLATPPNAAVQTSPDAGDTLSESRRLIEDGRASEAVSMLRRLVEENIRHHEYWNALAEALLYAGDAEGAQAVVDEGLLLFPGSALLHATAVSAARARGDSSAGLAAARVARELAVEKPGQEAAILYAAAGMASRRWGGEEKTDFEAAIRADPALALASAWFALDAAARGAAEDARRFLQRVGTPDSSDRTTAGLAGMALHSLGDHTAAVGAFEAALRDPFAEADVVRTAAAAYEAIGDTATAGSLLQRVRDLENDQIGDKPRDL